MLQCCIASIKSNSLFPHQIIVHINEGSDGTLEWIQSQNLDYSFSAQNAGVCYAVNAMANLARTDFLLYLNDDMYVCKNWDRAFWDEICSLPNHLWYLSGTMIEPLASNNKCVLAPHHFGRTPSDFQKEALDTFAATVRKNDWFGACWPPSLVHKALFQEVGGYSEEFSPGMYSDPDFGLKLWKAGVRHFRGLGNSLVYHFQSRSTGRVKRNNGRKQFAQKWGITASYFYQHMLKMGDKFETGITLSSPVSFYSIMAKVKAFLISIKA